jgi:hypothetical protein
MKQLLTAFTLLFLLVAQTAKACDCDSEGTFLTVAPKAKFIALVKINKYLTYSTIYGEEVPMSMEVEVIEVYKGIETRKRFTVWGDSGILCRPYLSKFTVGQHYVIAFMQGKNGKSGKGQANEKESDYFISICGDYTLKADTIKQIALGNITEKQNNITLSELKARLN